MISLYILIIWMQFHGRTFEYLKCLRKQKLEFVRKKQMEICGVGNLRVRKGWGMIDPTKICKEVPLSFGFNNSPHMRRVKPHEAWQMQLLKKEKLLWHWKIENSQSSYRAGNCFTLHLIKYRGIWKTLLDRLCLKWGLISTRIKTALDLPLKTLMIKDCSTLQVT